MTAVLSRARRLRPAAAGAALLAAAATLLVGSVPAHADTVFIEVNPSTTVAGYAVSMRASCGSTVNPAKATSDAFGTATLTPEGHFLIGTATVPANKPPHGYPVRLTCGTGSRATTTLWVISATAKPAYGPNTGGGFLAHNGGPGGMIMIATGLSVVGAGAVLALWTVRRRRETSDHRR